MDNKILLMISFGLLCIVLLGIASGVLYFGELDLEEDKELIHYCESSLHNKMLENNVDFCKEYDWRKSLE